MSTQSHTREVVHRRDKISRVHVIQQACAVVVGLGLVVLDHARPVQLIGQIMFGVAVMLMCRNTVIALQDPAVNEPVGISAVPIAMGLALPHLTLSAGVLAAGVAGLIIDRIPNTSWFARRDAAAVAAASASGALLHLVAGIWIAVSGALLVLLTGLMVPHVRDRDAEPARVDRWERVVIGGAGMCGCGLGLMISGLLPFGLTAGLLASVIVTVTIAVSMWVYIHNQRKRSLLRLADYLDVRMPMRKGHSERVAVLSAAMLAEAGFPISEQRHAWWSARLADVGMMLIDIERLLSSAKLTDDDRQQMQLHPARSVDIISEFRVRRHIREAVLCHHERPDGRGYLHRPASDVPFNSWVIAVADAMLAMVSDRPHRAGMSVTDAIEEIRRNRGTQFDEYAIKMLAWVHTSSPELLHALKAQAHDVVEHAQTHSKPELASDIQVVGYDATINEAAYRLSRIQDCVHAQLASHAVALVVRDNVDEVSLDWLQLSNVEVWVPVTMRITGVSPSSVFRYEIRGHRLIVRDHDGTTREDQEAPAAELYRWSAFSREASVRFVAVPLLTCIGLLVGALMGVTPVFSVPSGSMQPTLWCGDRLLTVPLRDEVPQRRDVVIFTTKLQVEGARTVKLRDERLVKRVMGIPGDRVVIRKNDVRINGKRIAGAPTSTELLEEKTLIIPPGKVLLLGDNRAHSADSRVFGLRPVSEIEARARLIMWPPQRWAVIGKSLPTKSTPTCAK